MFSYRSGLAGANGSPLPTTLETSEENCTSEFPPRLHRRETEPKPAETVGATSVVAVVEPRALARDTLVAALTAAWSQYRCRSFIDIEDWKIDPCSALTVALLVCLDGFAECREEIEEEIRQLVLKDNTVPVVAIGGSEELHDITRMLSTGVRGYIPTTVNLEVAVQAVVLAIAGGVFIPAPTLRKLSEGAIRPQMAAGWQFGLTERQGAVAMAVSQGKPNKIIAFDLGLSESTIKVHIRNIMKKMQAHNRTEIAFKLHDAK